MGEDALVTRLPLTRIAIAVLAAVGIVVGASSVARDDATVPASLASLAVAVEQPAGYDRDRFGYAWPDLDRDCFDTRDEVLIRDLDDEVVKMSEPCDVLVGTFTDPYTGVNGQAEAGALDIDHVVSLADAWRSGAHSWSDGRRFAYANDEQNLLATNDTANRCKGDKGPAEWSAPPGGSGVCASQRAPQDRALLCSYARTYIDTKARWGLNVTQQDREALATMLVACA